VETSTLRWILIIVGVIIVGSIFLFGNPEKKRKPKASRKKKEDRQDRLEPTLDGASGGEADPDSSGEAAAGEGSAGQGELPIDETPATAAPVASRPRAPAGPPPDKIASLFLLARDNHVITGAELLQAAVNTGMEYGEMDIFHRVEDGSEKSVFCMANAAKPGHFPRDEWNSLETSGVVLFMTLPGPIHALDAWDAMLATGRRMGEILQADLLDEERIPFTRQKEARLREEMRKYDRKKTKP